MSEQSRNRVKAISSAMQFWPPGDYSQHVPATSLETRIGDYWQAVGSYLNWAVDNYESRKSR